MRAKEKRHFRLGSNLNHKGREPRKSKNGTPEERAAKAAAEQGPPAAIVALSIVPDAEPAIDGRKLRGSPLRDCIGTISFGAAVVGKMHTAGLKGEPLEVIPPEIRQGWLELLERAIEANISVNIGLDQAMETLKALKAREANVLTGAEFEEVYQQLDPDGQAAIQQLVSSYKSESPILR
jgi:hypothetical protein